MNNNITIEVINGRYWNFILEEFNYEYYNKNKNIKISDEEKIKLKNIESQVESKIKEICPITGRYYNPDAKRERVINFELITTEHWYTKYFRNKYENPLYINPDLYEGIDIISNNIDEITRLIDVGLIQNNYRVIIKSRKVLYSEIVIFERINSKNYNITLQTQMKGKDYVSNTGINRLIKLPPKIKSPI